MKSLKKKILIGLTGTFGSGKSSVADMFAELGADIVDADKLAHEALEPKSRIYPNVAALFPGVLRNESGCLDRKKIGELVFSDPRLRKKLEALVHPYVFDRIREIAERSVASVVIAEVPLLFESGFDRFCDAVICVDAEPEVVRKRLLAKGFDEKEIEARQKAQLSAEEKKRRSAYCLDNSQGQNETRKNVLKIWEKLKHDKGE